MLAAFCCDQGEECCEREQDILHLRTRLEGNGIRCKSLRIGNDGTLCLNLSGTGITDLSCLPELPVTHLCLQGCYGISDFSPLRHMRLTWLNLCRTKTSDLSPLGKLPLSHLDLRRTATTDLLPLKDVPLRSLDIRFTKITDLSPLRCIPLQELRFHPTRIENWMAILNSMESLRRINRMTAEEFWKRHHN